jgi:hypothetical protein
MIGRDERPRREVPPEKDTLSVFAKSICDAIDITPAQLTQLSALDHWQRPSAAMIRQHIARRFNLPTTHDVGRQLVDRGVLSPPQGRFVDGLDSRE